MKLKTLCWLLLLVGLPSLTQAQRRSVAPSLPTVARGAKPMDQALAGQYVTTPFLPVNGTGSAGALTLAAGGQAAAIYYSATDAPVVGIAATALSADVQAVTGLKPTVSTDAPAAADNAVFVGTVGRSALINSLAAAGKIDVSSIQGQWESYLAVVVDNPVPGIGRGLVIAGSDRRGTAFGVFGLSEAMGISPWYWWADVTIPTQPALYVGPGTYTEPSPGVKYRGIFLNDEDWGLLPWAANTFDPTTGSIGPNTYAKMFELLLRLHANFIWPAMHTVTKAFYTFPQNQTVADNYAIVIGTSHQEPMLRNTDEYNPAVLGDYNYWTNRTNIYNFWDSRVNDTAGFENIYTIGMRGLTDGTIIAPSGTTTAGKVTEMQNYIIPDQRQMITNHVASNPATVPQIFVPYKEALTIYQAGLQVPDDATLVWPDDNHGYIRELSTTAEQARSGGSGVYYHFSYWGTPVSYLWLCTTPPALAWSEMSKAWDYGARRLWIVNVGDLKPGEIDTDMFLRMGRNPEAFRNFDQHAYLTQWATKVFGAAQADAVASVLDEYYRLNIIVRPEHLNLSSSGFSFTSNGDEAQQRLNDFAALQASAETLYAQLPANLQTPFYELVLYPVRASNLRNQEVLLAERSRLWATQGRAATNSLAASSQAAYNSIQTETAFYNATNAGGKWKGIMATNMPGSTGDTYLTTTPTLGSYSAPAAAGLGVAIEGSATAVTPLSPGTLPVFNPAANQKYFVDVFDTGAGALTWTAQANVPWITLSRTGGTGDARLLVGINWSMAPRGYAVPGSLTIQGAGSTSTVNVQLLNPPWFTAAGLPAAVENNGIVSMEAENYASSQDAASGAGWRKVAKAAASHDGMTVFPTTTASVDPSAGLSGAPSLTYRFYTLNSGPAVIQTACLPTHQINSEHPGCRYAIALNNEAPQVINIDAAAETDAWNTNVLRASALGTSYHNLAAPGVQTLTVWMIDPGVMLDAFKVNVQPGGFEVESLSASSTSGRIYRYYTETGASAGAGAVLEATTAGDYLTLAVPNLAAGSYDLTVRGKELNNRGIVQMSIADSLNGTYTNIGPQLNLFTSVSGGFYADLPGVRFTVATAGTKYLKFSVAGRDPANTSGLSWIVLDKLTFAPIAGTISQNSLEAENLSATSTPGETYRVYTETGASNGAGVALESVNVGDYVTLALPNLTAGSYDLTPRVKKLTNRGIVQMSIADSLGGTYADIGGAMDLYTANTTGAYVDMPSVRFTVATAGNKYLKFRVMGRNASNTSGLSWIVLDKIALSAFVSSNLDTWRAAYFGSSLNGGDAADLADPDGDGIPNLLEYATGMYPTVSNVPPWVVGMSNNHLTLTFPRQRNATDITYHVYASSGLTQAATEIWSSATVPYAGGAAASAPVTVFDPQSTADSPSRFLWLQVTRP